MAMALVGVEEVRIVQHVAYIVSALSGWLPCAGCSGVQGRVR